MSDKSKKPDKSQICRYCEEGDHSHCRDVPITPIIKNGLVTCQCKCPPKKSKNKT
jgi:hypothetical protein